MKAVTSKEVANPTSGSSSSLNRQYELCLTEQREEVFFPALAEYVQILLTDNNLLKILLANLPLMREADMADWKFAQAQYKKELVKGGATLAGYGKEKGITDPHFEEAQKKSEELMRGELRILGGDPLTTLYSAVYEMAYQLKMLGHSDFISQFERIDHDLKIPQLVIACGERETYEEQIILLSERGEDSIWGALEAIQVIHSAWYGSKREASELLKVGDLWSAGEALLKGAAIRRQVEGKPLAGDPHFDRSSYLSHLNRFHLRFTNLLLTSKPLVFDEVRGIIRYGNMTAQVKIETVEYHICRLTLANNRVAEIDILEATNRDILHTSRAVYDATNRLNIKAKQKLGINQLFVFKSGHVFLENI